MNIRSVGDSESRQVAQHITDVLLNATPNTKLGKFLASLGGTAQCRRKLIYSTSRSGVYYIRGGFSFRTVMAMKFCGTRLQSFTYAIRN